MSNPFFDFSDGSFCFSTSDNMAVNSEGDLMMRLDDHMAMNLSTGDLHMVSSWPFDDDDDN